LFVYIREAHADDEWQMDDNRTDGVVLAQPTDSAGRRDAALSCTASLAMTMPCVVDTMDDAADIAYAAWPERMYVIDTDGKIAYAGRRGPWGFRPDEVRRWLWRNCR
jgi:hypothetical protein